MNQNGQEWKNLIQMTIISTIVGKNPLEEIIIAIVIIVNKKIKMQYLITVWKMTEWSRFISKTNHSISQ